MAESGLTEEKVSGVSPFNMSSGVNSVRLLPWRLHDFVITVMILLMNVCHIIFYAFAVFQPLCVLSANNISLFKDLTWWRTEVWVTRNLKMWRLYETHEAITVVTIKLPRICFSLASTFAVIRVRELQMTLSLYVTPLAESPSRCLSPC